MDERVPGVVESLIERKFPVVLISPERESDYDVDLSRETIAFLTGDPTDPMLLVQARITSASVLVVTGESVAKSRHIAKLASDLNPGLPVVIRTEHFDSEEAFADLSNVTVVSDTIATSFCLEEDDDAKEGIAETFRNAYPRIVRGLRRRGRAE